MKAYAVAIIRETQFNDDVANYLRRIDETLLPFQENTLFMVGLITPLRVSGWATWL